MATQNPRLPELWMEVTDPKKIARLMVIQEVSARTVAKAAGWKSHTYMQRLLRGEAKRLDPEPAVRIAWFLGVGTDDLFVARSSSEAREVIKYERTLRKVSA